MRKLFEVPSYQQCFILNVTFCRALHATILFDYCDVTNNCNVLQELLKVLYVDPELTYLKDLELSGAGSAEKSDSSYDGRNGVRSIRISPDGKHLASGDRAGNIRYVCVCV